MTRRAARWTVVLMLAAIGIAATHQALTRYKSIDAMRDRLDTIDVLAAQTDRALVEIAASERGYVAPGQGLDFWAARVDEALASAREALQAMRWSRAADAAAAARAESALSRLDDFSDMDRRARDFTRDGQPAMASDLIFADGYEMIAAARADAAGAAAALRSAIAAPMARDRQLHLAALAALAGCALVALLFLLRAPKPIPAASTGAELAPDVPSSSLRATETPAEEPEATLSSSATPLSRVDLSEAADICVDLARLLDARDLQAVLARTARVLEAEGLIVWMTDASGQSLAPALSHGYAPAVISRVGAIHMDDANATAGAWRAKAAQIVESGPNQPGALAVPMLTSDGCIGVLALELKEGRERASDVLSLARIVAAQLAAGVTGTAAETRKAAEA